MKIQIIGMGNTGKCIASFLLKSSLKITEMGIIDIDDKKMLGNYYDLLDMLNLMGKRNVMEIGMIDADYYIITAGKPRKNSKDDHDFRRNYEIVKKYVRKIGNKNKVILIITNPVNRICLSIKRDFGINVIPIGNKLDSIRDLNELIVDNILNNKGYTEFGIAQEVENFLLE